MNSSRKIIYIPGNHDHHLWESARETQYVSNYLAETKPETLSIIPWHTTNIFMEDDPNPVPSFFLNALVQRYDHLQNLNINTAYPNFGLRQGQPQRHLSSRPLHRVHLSAHDHPEKPDLSQAGRRCLARCGTWRRKTSPGSTFSGPPWGAPENSARMWKSSMTRCRTKSSSGSCSTPWPTAWRRSTTSPAWETGLTLKVTKLIINGLVDKLVNPERTRAEQPLSQDAEQGLLDYVNWPLQIQT